VYCVNIKFDENPSVDSKTSIGNTQIYHKSTSSFRFHGLHSLAQFGSELIPKNMNPFSLPKCLTFRHFCSFTLMGDQPISRSLRTQEDTAHMWTNTDTYIHVSSRILTQ